MKGLKKFLLTAGLCLGALGLCMGNAATVATSDDFNCVYSASAYDGEYVYYGSTEVKTYTAEEAAAAGVPAGYEGEVLEVLGATNRGFLVDFSAQQIPIEMVEAFQFRVYLGVATENEGTNYPQIRIPRPFALGDRWIYQKGEATPTGEWTTVTVETANVDVTAISENGYLNKFELSTRSKASISFYVDSIDYVLKAPTINYTGNETISVALGEKLRVPATAMDGAGNSLDLQYIWEDGVELDENGTPTQVGEYTLTLKATDSYGGETTKTVMVVVTEEAVAVDSDFQCLYSANPNKLLHGYGSSAVNTYTAAEAAAKGIPAGYENEVLEVISLNNNVSNGIILDFSAEEIPVGMINSIEFRVYVGVSDKNTGNYPQLRIPDPSGSGAWVYQKNEALPAGEWTTFTLTTASHLEYLCQDGKLAAFELSMRSNGHVDFYIDSITCALKAPVINYTGEDPIFVSLGKSMYVPATATDAAGNPLDLEYIWEDGVELNANGTPTQLGTYTLTLKAVDSYGGVTIKEVQVLVEEGDNVAPEIALNFTEVKTMVGTVPMLSVSATDNNGAVTLTKTWSDGALDKKGGLTAGTHTWTITAIDKFANKTTKTVTFIVTEEEPAYDFVTDEADMFGECIVTFDGQNSISVPYGFKVARPADPVKEADEAAKYTFIGWFVGDEEWDFENNVVTSNLDIQSKWEETKRIYRVGFEGYTSTYKLEYGSLIPTDVIPGNPSRPASTRVEYVFAGWGWNGVLWNFETDVVRGEMTLEPMWTEQARLYKVTFDGENEQLLAYGSKIERPADPVKEDTATTRYEFLGWFNGDKEWNFEQGTITYHTNLQSKWREIPIEGAEPEQPDEPVDSDVNTDSEVNTNSGNDTAQPGMDSLLAGCSGVIGGVASGLMALGVAAYVLLKKKENE